MLKGGELHSCKVETLGFHSVPHFYISFYFYEYIAPWIKLNNDMSKNKVFMVIKLDSVIFNENCGTKSCTRACWT